MKRFKIILIPVFLLAVFSCEKVIDPSKVDLPPHEEIIFIEGEVVRKKQNNVIDATGPFYVTIRKSKAYLDHTEGFTGVLDAVVTLRDDAGNSEVLTHLNHGMYQSGGQVEAIENRTYTLEVVINGSVYSASSFLSPMSEFTATPYVYEEETGFFPAGYFFFSQWRREADASSFFRVRAFKNDKIWYGDPEVAFKYLLVDDSYGLSENLNFFIPYNYEPGDTAMMELMSLDEATYVYFQSIDQQGQAGTSPLAPVPGNVRTNFDGKNVMGHFSAYASHRIQTVVTE